MARLRRDKSGACCLHTPHLCALLKKARRQQSAVRGAGGFHYDADHQRDGVSDHARPCSWSLSRRFGGFGNRGGDTLDRPRSRLGVAPSRVQSRKRVSVERELASCLTMPKLKLPRPRPLPYDALRLSEASWGQKVEAASRAWAIQGYGAPKIVYVFDGSKSSSSWWVDSSSARSPMAGLQRALDENILTLESFKRILLYSMTFELLGLGCGSGPLTARYVPPVAACLHFGRPGTAKLPFLKRVPGFRRTTRGWIEASLYWCLIGISLSNLFGPSVDHVNLSWTLGLLVCLSLSDKTIFLAARGEHYAVMLFCLLFPQTGLLGPICVQMALWLWAAVSKLTPNFPSVVAAMLSNSPVVPGGPFKRRLYRDFLKT